MANVKIDENELARLRANQAALAVLTTDHETLVRQTNQAFRLISGAPKLVAQLTNINGPESDSGSTAGTPTTDGQGWKVDFVLMTLVIAPMKDELQLVDVTDVVPTGYYKLGPDGSITADIQERIIGHAERIKRASETGVDPVVDSVSLIGEVVTA